jgi:hypothetical protein
MSNDFLEKVTPKGDLSWYIKWTASAFLLFAVMCRSVEEVPKIYDVILSFAGTSGWAIVGFLWHDRAILSLNVVLTFILGTSILRYYVGG